MDIAVQIAEELGIKTWQAEAVINLIDEGNTIPFIARYRKEAHGSLNDEQLRNLNERLAYLRKLAEKKEQVIASIEGQGRLTEELKAQIMQAQTQVVVDDLYRPYRPKRRTRATIAKEKGLAGLADIILAQDTTKDITVLAEAYISEEKGVPDIHEAIAGAKDIIAEAISDNAEYRIYIRKAVMKEGKVVSTAKDSGVHSVYGIYYGFTELVSKIAGYQVLALNRGEKEKFLVVKIEAPEERILVYLEKKIINPGCNNKEIKVILKEAAEDSYKRLIEPAIEREVRGMLTEKAEDGAIRVFGKNLGQLLMQPPVAGRNVLGWDPAFRTGCKLAVVDSTGKVLDTAVVYPVEPHNKVEETKRTVKELVEKYDISVISVGNGTASRESEKVIAEIIKEIKKPVQYIIVNEAGASVYSASKLATEELAGFDVGQRSAASIARRLQDPLAELVKIAPESIGVGQYQHDIDQKKLSEALAGVVEDCVNKTGVDLNTASAPLLEHISGITKTVAKNIVMYREQNGRFTNRKQLLKVARLGPKVYEQCAGFMRIQDGDNPLDATSVHPEAYGAAEKLLEKLGITSGDLKQIQREAQKSNKGKTRLADRIKDKKSVAKELGIGEITLGDILKELEKPARDPRTDMTPQILRTDVLEIKDLKEGMVLKGTVRNVIDFGAFVDIGVHQDGLVHISQLTDGKFVKHPLEVVSVGDIVDVKVLSVDEEKQRIQLSMKL